MFIDCTLTEHCKIGKYPLEYYTAIFFSNLSLKYPAVFGETTLVCQFVHFHPACMDQRTHPPPDPISSHPPISALRGAAGSLSSAAFKRARNGTFSHRSPLPRASVQRHRHHTVGSNTRDPAQRTWEKSFSCTFTQIR